MSEVRGELTWCEVSASALERNIKTLKGRLPPNAALAVAVKSNAYGHGLELASKVFLRAGADWLCVHSLAEARVLRACGVSAPLYLFGPIAPESLDEAVSLELRLVTYTHEQVTQLAEVCERQGRVARLHLKVETGNHRQGLPLEELIELAERVSAHPLLELEGLSSHFANIEDTTDHSYAEQQLRRFDEAFEALSALNMRPPMRHIANSAASLLWPERAMEMARVGVSAYGLWPSKDTQGVALQRAQLAGEAPPLLTPALTWKARVAQVKEVPTGASVGYGCTFVTTRPSRIAVLPVGYFEGYDRGLSNTAHVLLHGRRAPVRGRVCMNMCMVDVTDIPEASLGDEAVLLGEQEGVYGREEVSAEQLAAWAGTINYEIVSRVSAHLARLEAP